MWCVACVRACGVQMYNGHTCTMHVQECRVAYAHSPCAQPPLQPAIGGLCPLQHKVVLSQEELMLEGVVGCAQAGRQCWQPLFMLAACADLAAWCGSAWLLQSGLGDECWHCLAQSGAKGGSAAEVAAAVPCLGPSLQMATFWGALIFGSSHTHMHTHTVSTGCSHMCACVRQPPDRSTQGSQLIPQG